MNLAARVRQKLRLIAFEKRVRTSPRSDLARLGTGYGGWWVPLDLLDADSVCYLAGVGEDVSFDLALIDRMGCEVWAMDPTPRSIAFAETVTEPRFHFLPVGVWSENTTLRFYAPRDPAHVSHSIVNAQGTDSWFEAEALTVRSVMTERGHDRVDLLKLDIEGAEVAVLEQALHVDGLRPRVLCVEFDAPEPVSALVRHVDRLRGLGYVPVKVDGLNVTLVLS